MRKVKVNIPMLAALVLLLLTMVSSHFVSGLYARYTGYADSRTSARVAKFDVQSQIEKNNDGTYTLTVVNASQVTVKYGVTLDMDPHLLATLDGMQKEVPAGADSVTFTKDEWLLAPNETAELTLELTVSDWSGLTDPNTRSGEMEQITLDFAVNVIAEQAD